MKTIFLNMSVKININKVIHNKSKIINITVIKMSSILYNIMILYSIVFLSLVQLITTINLPCASNCDTCSSATQCTTCASQYYATTSNGTLQCISCGAFCLNCTSSTNCTACISPYVIQSDGSCAQCQISNAAKCKSTVSASQCVTGYYVSDNYCYSCLLNCADCSSNSDCRSCFSGYYLNSSVLTCNFCPVTCLSCDPYNSTRCLTCKDGYSLSMSYTCDLITCSLTNCTYCQSSSTCKQCDYGYYWSSVKGSCVQGASILCTNGAEGPYPNQCNIKCSSFGYIAKQNSTAIWCLPYHNISINSSNYYQFYLYSYNNLNKLQQILSTSKSLTLESTGQYSYLIQQNNELSLPSLPPFYKIFIFIKYRASSAISLTLSSTTQTTTQQQNNSLPAFSTACLATLNTVYLHSNNLKIKFQGSLYLVELLVRTKNCPSYCYRCLNQDLCEMCNAPQYVSSYKCVDNCTIYYHLVVNRTCLTSCPDSFYPQNLGVNQKYCQPCISPCSRCMNQILCLSCVAGKYLYNYTCITNCPDTFYADSSGICAPCISPCLLCVNQTTCISCKEGYWNNLQNVCTIQCPNGYYGNDLTKKCEICKSPCLTCRNTSTKCLTCLTGLYYHEYNCLTKCPQKFYPISANLTCQACILPCFTCSSNTSCLSCAYNYLFNSQCLGNCPDGYFENLATKSCSTCSSQCRTCQMLGECTNCYIGKCFLEGSCVSTCPAGKYYTSITNQSTIYQQCECLECPYPCKQCTSTGLCLSCLQGFYFSATHQCLNTCPNGYFSNISTFQCTICSSKYTINCIQCNLTACTRCATNYLLHNGQCLTQCPSLHYKSSQTCQKCVAPCLDCSSFSQCISCISPYLFNNGSCIIQCPFGRVSYLNSTSNNLICIACQLPCITCQNSSPTNCTLCQYTYFLYSPNNTCVAQCSSIALINTFYNELVTSTCSKCMFPCQTCSTQTQCLTCQIGFLTSNGKCQNCPYGTFANITTGTCISCPASCSNCFSSTYCTGCNLGYYLYAHQCISNVSICQINGYYAIGRVCQPCQMPCAQCNQTSSNCLNCVTGYIFYYPNQCITQCPKGTFRNGTQCSLCHPFCLTCSGSSENCFTCKSNYYMIPSEMSCVSSCPNNTFITGYTCQLCQYPCLECSSQTQCLSCITGTLVGSSCWSSCPSGYFSILNTCKACQSPCLECQSAANQCKQCITGYYLFQNQCLPSCPAGYFGQTSANQCLQCLGLCDECSSIVNCTTCLNNLTFYYDVTSNQGVCVSECPNSFYPITNPALNRQQCANCLPSCLTCSNNFQCILCKNNKPQHLGQCISQCPGQMYSYNGICKNCSQPCLNCTDTFTCTACMNNSFLLVGKAECIVGEICPQGFYRIPNTRDCNSTCPPGYYYRNDRTCNNQGCDIDEYKGADMHCYQKCPNDYISDKNYSCRQCYSSQECSNGLFYEVQVMIIRDRLVLYLIFKQDPIYKTDSPSIQLEPYFKSKTTLLTKTKRILQTETTVDPIRNITIQLYPQQSFAQISLTIRFLSAFATFQNPIQRTYKTIILPGYDLYPQTPTISIGILLLACALMGMIKNPFMTDFGQLIYLMALIDLHYPQNLASVLQSALLAHLHGFISLDQHYVTGKAKFSYITDMGLLSNSFINLVIIVMGLVIFLLVFIVFQILKKLVQYNKIKQDPYQSEKNVKQAQQQHKNKPALQIEPERQRQHEGNSTHVDNRISYKIFDCLQKYYIEDFKMSYLNRLIYFNYLPISIFTLTQLSSMHFSSDSLIDLIASILAIALLIGLLVYPLVIFTGNKPKYTFLMLRKLILAVAIVLSVQNPTYMIGVTAVMSIMSGILVGAYGMEKWQVQTRFIAGMQFVQAVLMICFATFAIIGQGKYTTTRLYLSWIIICLIIGICFTYIVFSIFCFVLWSCKKFRGVDYIHIWKQDEAQNLTQHDSQTNSHKFSTKQQQNKVQRQKEKQQVGKTITLEKLLTNLNINKFSVKQMEQEGPGQKYRIKGSKSKLPISPYVTHINNNQLFWTYNDNQQPEQDLNQPKAPEMLIRCVNQFSDYDERERKQRNKQYEQNDSQQSSQKIKLEQKNKPGDKANKK